MAKKSSSQKIKCDVCDCTHNNDSKTCKLDEIDVCCCNGQKAKTVSDTACKSYENQK
ncbi:MAG: DUF1540 domain-containing protein [Clostridia bacterium]